MSQFFCNSRFGNSFETRKTKCDTIIKFYVCLPQNCAEMIICEIVALGFQHSNDVHLLGGL